MSVCWAVRWLGPPSGGQTPSASASSRSLARSSSVRQGQMCKKRVTVPVTDVIAARSGETALRPGTALRQSPVVASGPA